MSRRPHVLACSDLNIQCKRAEIGVEYSSQRTIFFYNILRIFKTYRKLTRIFCHFLRCLVHRLFRSLSMNTGLLLRLYIHPSSAEKSENMTFLFLALDEHDNNHKSHK